MTIRNLETKAELRRNIVETLTSKNIEDPLRGLIKIKSNKAFHKGSNVAKLVNNDNNYIYIFNLDSLVS